MTYFCAGLPNGNTRNSPGVLPTIRTSTQHAAVPALLTERKTFRDGLQMGGERFTWQRPASSAHPGWYVPQQLQRAAVELIHHEDEGEEPRDETEASWYTVMSFSSFNAAGTVDGRTVRGERTTDGDGRTSTVWTDIERLSGSAMAGQGNRWSERFISYDPDGNILSLDRYQDDGCPFGPSPLHLHGGPQGRLGLR